MSASVAWLLGLCATIAAVRAATPPDCPVPDVDTATDAVNFGAAGETGVRGGYAVVLSETTAARVADYLRDDASERIARLSGGAATPQAAIDAAEGVLRERGFLEGCAQWPKCSPQRGPLAAALAAAVHDAALAEVAAMRRILWEVAAGAGLSDEDAASGQGGGRPAAGRPPPEFMAAERRGEAAEYAAARAAADAAAASVVAPDGSDNDDGGAGCSAHHDCDSCRAASCAWCISSRRCVPDVAWMCDGEHDHVGALSPNVVQQCPTISETRAAHEARRALKSEADRARIEPSKPKADATPASSGDAQEHLEARQRAEERLEQRGDEELRRVAAELKAGDDAEGAGAEPSKPQPTAAQLERLEQLRRRADAAASGAGGQHDPYATLGVSKEATQSEIRRAYRRLTVVLHPDKNDADAHDIALAAFRDLVVAFEIIGNPDKRAAFDDFGGHADDNGGFASFYEYAQSGTKDERDFYSHHPLITNLTPELWDRRVVANSIWLVEMYAPWCAHCQTFAAEYKAVAAELVDDDVEVGAVNCETRPIICREWFNVKSYPTFMLISANGMQQLHHGNNDAASLTAWVRAVAAEWRYLFGHADLAKVTPDTFADTVLRSEDMWVVAFIDSPDCGACRVALTNMMRLSARLRGMARVAVVDCSDDSRAGAVSMEHFCYTQQGLPRPPHAPIVRAWSRGNGTNVDVTNRGEDLYNSNDVDPHVALQIAERAVRLALQSTVLGASAVSAGAPPDFEAEQAEDDEPPQQQPPPEPLWNGPALNAPEPPIRRQTRGRAIGH